MKQHTGILLVNLGTPDSPQPKDVYKYLNEFLTDGRVIDIPWLWRQMLVRFLIVPFRYKQSAAAYQKIWSANGSPLMVYGKKVSELLQAELGESFHVELAMRYQSPSIRAALGKLLKNGISRLLVLPLFPQYASATTGSVHQKVMQELSSYPVIPEVVFVNNYAVHPALIDAFCAASSRMDLKQYDHILFSFHGLPERQLRKADQRGWCLQSKACCQHYCEENSACYSAQCHATAMAIGRQLEIPLDKMSISFQSRLGKEPWLQPYTSAVIPELARLGKKNVAVYCPSFVCDCLETLYEIGIEYAHDFRKAGGERLDLVPGLNDDPVWISSLKAIIGSYLGTI
jgi:ferrochelatase